MKARSEQIAAGKPWTVHTHRLRVKYAGVELQIIIRLGCKTLYPNIERWFMALGEATPYVRRPNTVTPLAYPSSATDYQDLVAYNAHCADNPQIWSPDDVSENPDGTPNGT